MNEGYIQEKSWAWVAVLAGAVLAVGIWPYGNQLGNFALMWGPHALALTVMLSIRARPAAIAGAALAFAGYLRFFLWWLQTYYANDGMAWLVYLFSLPGGLVGAIVAAISLNKRDERPATAAGLIAAAYVIAGIAINQVAVQIALS